MSSLWSRGTWCTLSFSVSGELLCSCTRTKGTSFFVLLGLALCSSFSPIFTLEMPTEALLDGQQKWKNLVQIIWNPFPPPPPNHIYFIWLVLVTLNMAQHCSGWRWGLGDVRLYLCHQHVSKLVINLFRKPIVCLG